MTTAPILRATGLGKSFGAVHALINIDLEIRAGEVLALLGENGAGKSTFVALASGALRPSAGQLEFDGRPDVLGSPLEASRAGVQVVHQDPKLANELSIAENIFLSRLAAKRWYRRSERRQVNQDANELLERLGLARELPAVTTKAGQLSPAGRQLVEIARSMASRARLVFLDEPNSSLTPRETALLWSIVTKIRDEGVAVVIVSHRLRELYQVAQTVAVLRDGRLVGTGSVTEIPVERAIRLMAGRELVKAERPEKASAERGPEVLRMQNVSTDHVRGLNLTLHAGEVVGLAGLVGSGRTEIGRAIGGVDRLRSGRIFLRGNLIGLRSPRQALKVGIAMTAEERRHAAFTSHAVRFNATTAVIDRISRWGVLAPRVERKAASAATARLAVRGTLDTQVTALSGGNQQKVYIGRMLATDPAVLILDEPTHGIDVNTKAEIVQLVRSLADDGKAILYISSEVEELLAVSDRVLVAREGRIVSEAHGSDAIAVVGSALGEQITVPAAPWDKENIQ